ncbi:MAG: 3-hydroxybutyryl-CoA dehydrogenase [Acidobacteria bacterium]|nr:MAG: 3-hydroxybutyryl-CoA dehydrogenase [Acidobacteriota bacterium]
MEITKVAVIGGGTMGNGIAHVLAKFGVDVTLIEANAGAGQKALTTIEKNLAREVSKGKLDEAASAAARRRITLATDVAAAASAQLAIEAVPELRDIKLPLLAQLNKVLSPEALIASNTSSISITELASASGRPEQFVGMHFMNPVPMMKLVEVIRGLQTSDATVKAVQDLALRLEKTPVEVHDYPGFIANRVLLPMINEAIYCVMEGVATPEAIDEIMKLGMAHPMGPLTLADFIGLDVCLHIMEVLHDGLGDSKYRPCPLLRNMVAAGWLGRKTARGFYKY